MVLLDLTFLPFYFDLTFPVFFHSSVLMHPEHYTDLDNLDTVENNLRHSAKGSNDAYDVTHSLTHIVAEHGCSATACAAGKPRLLKNELDGKETNPIPTIGEMKELGEDVLNADNQKLMALVQTRQTSDLNDSEIRTTGVEAHRTDSVDGDVLSDLIDNAQAQLSNACHAVSNAAHSFALLRRSLEKQLMQDNRATTQTNGSEFPSSLEAGRSDLAKTQTSLAAALTSEAAGKNSYAQVTWAMRFQ